MADRNSTRSLLERLRDEFLICDGAMGTTLSAGGHEPGRALELLNVEQPDLVRAAHRAYVEAGADIIETNTFQASRSALERHGLGKRARELNLAGARLAREVAGDTVVVAGSIGPTGKVLEPYGDYAEADAKAAFSEQADALAEGGVDMFIVETFVAAEEVCAAIRAAAATGLPVAASMSFDPSGRTAFGVTPEVAAGLMEAAGAAIVGANCGTISSAEMVDVVRGFRAATSLPLIAQPNAGRPQRTGQSTIYPETPEMMADSAQRFRDLGVSIIGACCGSSAAHIRAIAQRLRGA